jgi:hypothetical protein
MEVQAHPNIAVLEDDARRIERMRQLFIQRYPEGQIRFFEDAMDFCKWLDANAKTMDVISLDFDLPVSAGTKPGKNDGLCVANHIVELAATAPIIVHSSNPVGADSMYWALHRAGNKVVRVFPYDDLAWIDQSWVQAVESNLNL